MTDGTRLLTISKAAARLGISVEMLRVYADKGDVPVVRLPSGYRRFDPATIDRVRAEWESNRIYTKTDDDGGSQ